MALNINDLTPSQMERYKKIAVLCTQGKHQEFQDELEIFQKEMDLYDHTDEDIRLAKQIIFEVDHIRGGLLGDFGDHTVRRGVDECLTKARNILSVFIKIRGM